MHMPMPEHHDESETPWIDSCEAVDVPMLVPPLETGHCMIIFGDRRETPAWFSIISGVTVFEAATAHAKLVGMCVAFLMPIWSLLV